MHSKCVFFFFLFCLLDDNMLKYYLLCRTFCGLFISDVNDAKSQFYSVASLSCGWVAFGYKDGQLCLCNIEITKTVTTTTTDTVDTATVDTATVDTATVFNATVFNATVVNATVDTATVAAAADTNTITGTTTTNRMLLPGHNDVVNSIIEVDQTRFASCSNDKTVRIWDLVSNTCMFLLCGHTKSVTSLMRVGTPCRAIVSASRDETIRVWNVSTGLCLHCITDVSTGGAWSLVNFFTDTLFIGFNNGEIQTMHVSDFTCIPTLTHVHTLQDFDMYSVAGLIALPGDRFAYITRHNSVRICSLQGEVSKCVYELRHHTNVINSIVLSLDQRYLITCSDDFSIILWNIATAECCHPLKGHTAPVICLLILPDGDIVSGSADGTVRIWDIHTLQCKYVLPHKGNVYLLLPHVNGGFLSVSDFDSVKLWQ